MLWYVIKPWQQIYTHTFCVSIQDYVAITVAAAVTTIIITSPSVVHFSWCVYRLMEIETKLFERKGAYVNQGTGFVSESKTKQKKCP